MNAIAEVDPRSIPAEFISKAAQDPAVAWPGAPPNFGKMVVPHIMTVSGRVSTKAYLWADEAIRDSRQNAERMRTDCGIMESVEARQRAVSLLNWHLAPEDEASLEQKQLADEMTRVIRRTPQFAKLRFSLGDARWYGRSGIAMQFHKDYVGGRMRTLVKRWEPRNGDKLVFRYDDGSHKYDPDQIGIRIGGAYDLPSSVRDITGQMRQKIEGTEHGLVYWLDEWERRTMIINKHIIEDGPWEDPVRAGAINGVGIRDRIYWTWYGMVECLSEVLTYLTRSAFGIEIWTYPAGNDEAKKRCEQAANNVSGGGRTVLIVPRFQGEDADLFGVQHIEPSMSGIESGMSLVKEYFGHKIKRYILGQTLTSEAAATGLGSGVAEAHMATFADIVKMDAVGDEEVITTDLVRPLQLWNFPQSRGIYLRFVIDTDSPEAEAKMRGYKQAWDMGARIKEEDVLSTIGASMPKQTDKVLVNPSIAQAQDPMGMTGATGMPGIPGSTPGQVGDLQHLFGPLAELLGDGAGMDEPPPGQGPNDQPEGPPQQFAQDGEPERYAARWGPKGGKKQLQSSPGQQPIFEDVSDDKNPLWVEELHPRDAGGRFAPKGTGHVRNTFGQVPLFSELASRIHAAEVMEQELGPRGAEIQQDLFRTLAESNATPEQVKALLSGDPEELAVLKQIAEDTGRLEPAEEARQNRARITREMDEGRTDAMEADRKKLAEWRRRGILKADPPTPAADESKPAFELEQGKVKEGRPDPIPDDTKERQGLLLDEMHDLPGQKRFFGGEEERAKDAASEHMTIEGLPPAKKGGFWRGFVVKKEADGTWRVIGNKRGQPSPIQAMQELKAMRKVYGQDVRLVDQDGKHDPKADADSMKELFDQQMSLGAAFGKAKPGRILAAAFDEPQPAFGEQELDAPTQHPESPAHEAQEAIAGMPFHTRDEARAVAQKIQQIAERHGMQGEELWRDVMGEPEGSSSWPLYDQADDDERRSLLDQHRPGREAAREQSRKIANGSETKKRKREPEYSDQEISEREYARVFNEVMVDPTKSSKKDLSQASGFLNHLIRRVHRQKKRGEIDSRQHADLVDGYTRELDHVDSLIRDYNTGRKAAPADDMSRAEKIAEEAFISDRNIGEVAKEMGLSRQELMGIRGDVAKLLEERKEAAKPEPSEARQRAMAKQRARTVGQASESPIKSQSPSQQPAQASFQVVVNNPPPGGWKEEDKLPMREDETRHKALVSAGSKPWTMTEREWREKAGGDTGYHYSSDVRKAILAGERVEDSVLDQGDGSLRTFKEVTDNDRKYTPDQLGLMKAKAITLTESDYVTQQLLKKQREAEHQAIYVAREIAKLGPRATTKRKQLEGHRDYWLSVAKQESTGEAAEKRQESIRQKYRDEINAHISKGLVTDPKIIDQHPEFRLARTARERYEKGLHTSFANKSIAVDTSMKARRGYKAKQQDGRELSEANRKELEQGVDEIEAAIGSLKDLFEYTDVTLAHTNGKYPFLSTAGGLYHGNDRTITSGTKIKTIFGDVETKALAHEVGHWLDFEAGRAMGWNGTAYHYSVGSRGRGKRVSTTSLAERNQQLEHDASDKSDLIERATGLINDQREVIRRTKATLKKARDDEDRANIELAKVTLGPYWRSPTEVWARLFEQYVGDHHGESKGQKSHNGRDYFKRPGYWSEKDWQNLKPLVKKEIDRRLELLYAAAKKGQSNE
jgi:hypothetical protein